MCAPSPKNTDDTTANISSSPPSLRISVLLLYFITRPPPRRQIFAQLRALRVQRSVLALSYAKRRKNPPGDAILTRFYFETGKHRPVMSEQGDRAPRLLVNEPNDHFPIIVYRMECSEFSIEQTHRITIG